MIRWLIWAIFVIVWTVALQAPIPKTDDLPAGEVIATNRQFIAKSAHAAVYAVFAALSAWAPMPGRYRWLMMFFLMTHAWASEMLQFVLDWGRTGTLFDVGLNIAGLAVGAALTWKRWCKD